MTYTLYDTGLTFCEHSFTLHDKSRDVIAEVSIAYHIFLCNPKEINGSTIHFKSL